MNVQPFDNHNDVCYWAKENAQGPFSALATCDTGEGVVIHRLTVTRSEYNVSGWGWGWGLRSRSS